jgi:hypothetical protein
MPDPRERQNDAEEAFRAAWQGLQAGLWTAMPGIIDSFDPVKMTCQVTLSIFGQQRAEDGTIIQIQIKPLQDCPVVFPSGGGFNLTFPLTEGDEVLVVLASRCIDSWWQSGGIQSQAELRMHDLSDGFVLPGVRSQPRVLSGGVSTSATQIRSDDGNTAITLKNGEIDIVADKVRIHGNQETIFEANGTGFRYKPGFIDTYTDGVPGADHSPNAPEIPF